MLKGYQRKLIMMSTKSSPLFETAYFILRKETEERAPGTNEMLCEATRILEEHAITEKKRPITPKCLFFAFAIGAVLGALAVGILWISVSYLPT